MADTVNFSWTKPTVGGDSGAWGTILNTLFDDQDTDVDLIKTTADAALARAGGTMTGEIFNLTDRYVVDTPAIAAGVIIIDLDLANFFAFTVTEAITTVTFSNVPAGPDGVFFTMEITDGGAFAVTWPASVKWPGGTAPTLVASGVDVVTFYTSDGGTTIRGALAMADSK